MVRFTPVTTIQQEIRIMPVNRLRLSIRLDMIPMDKPEARAYANSFYDNSECRGYADEFLHDVGYDD
jgi:hypothetical protein